MGETGSIDRGRLAGLIERERATYAARHPGSRAAHAAAGGHLLAGVPMTWMRMWPGGFPLYQATARGARVTDVDGHEFTDFCLGDTGAMAGHSPAPVRDAVSRRYAELGGATTMLPTEDAAWVAAELARRFGVSRWSFTLTATDANRWALRLARQLTGRPKILVFSYCYHGSVDESFIVATDSGPRSRTGNTGAPVDPSVTTRVVEFNDAGALERELAHRDVAAVLMEPALTNTGIVLPAPGYLDAVRALTRAHGTLLINDETHTFSAGPGGCTLAWALSPDMVTIGKAIAGGIPAGAYGLSDDLSERILGDSTADIVDTGGVGGTLAGNALSVAATRATLEHVLTDAAFGSMIDVATYYTEGVRQVLASRSLPWHITRLGARAEYRFCPAPPVNGGQSNAAADAELDEYMHLYTINRGVLMTPFHNMALMCPATTKADVDTHTAVFAAAADELAGLQSGRDPERRQAGRHRYDGGDDQP
jgi:glutamate-1-semialdehyde 2,1-aminomutase